MFIGNTFNKMMEGFQYVYSTPFLWGSLFVFLIIATYTDIKDRKIPNALNLSFVGVRLAVIPFAGFGLSDVFGAVLGLLLLLVPAMIVMQPMGGDIKTAFVMGLYFGVYFTPIFLLLSSVMLFGTLFYFFQTKKKATLLPFAPYFLISHTIFMLYSLLS